MGDMVSYQIQRAIEMASQAHEGQMYGDRPYIDHPIEVADSLEHLGEDVRIIALLHDAVEDSDLTINHIREAFGGTVASAVDSLTKVEGQDQASYIKGLHDLAVPVKLMDSLLNYMAITEDTKTPEWRERKRAEYLRNVSHLVRVDTWIYPLRGLRGRAVVTAVDTYPNGWD